LLLAVATLTAASDAGAQRIQLELRPRAGDTLRMRLDQTVEMSGAKQGTAAKQAVTTMSMFSRAIVQSTDATSAMILAITDSVDVKTTDEHARALSRDASQLEGRTIRLRLSPDGTVAVAEQQPNVPREVNELVSVMPASFPREQVVVGDTWTRRMPIPPSAGMGIPAGGLVRATFRLDSTSAAGDVAYISMRGTLHDATGSTAAGTLNGTVGGNLVVDRKRGWLSESRFLIQMRVLAGLPGAPPMEFRTKITQHMKVSARR